VCDDIDMTDAVPSGDGLLGALSALASPHRLRIVAALAGGRNYISQLARDLGMSRPLLHMHLRKLEDAGLIVGTLELSKDGKAMKYFETTPFLLTVTPEIIRTAVETLTDSEPEGSGR
jgi:DNA-binding transcriptional ArsR family regulator